MTAARAARTLDKSRADIYTLPGGENIAPAKSNYHWLSDIKKLVLFADKRFVLK